MYHNLVPRTTRTLRCLVYLVLVGTGLFQAYRVAVVRRDALALVALAIAALVVLQWLNGGQYSVALILWLVSISTLLAKLLPAAHPLHGLAASAFTFDLGPPSEPSFSAGVFGIHVSDFYY